MHKRILVLLLALAVLLSGISLTAQPAQAQSGYDWCVKLNDTFALGTPGFNLVRGSRLNNVMLQSTDDGLAPDYLEFDWTSPVIISAERVVIDFGHDNHLGNPNQTNQPNTSFSIDVDAFGMQRLYELTMAPDEDFAIEILREPEDTATTVFDFYASIFPNWPRLTLRSLQIYGSGENPLVGLYGIPCDPELTGTETPVATPTLPGGGQGGSIDWCYFYDFALGSYEASVGNGQWEESEGFATSASGISAVYYSYQATVAARYAVVSIERADEVEGPIDITFSANIYGIQAGPTQETMEAEEDFLVFEMEPTSASSGTSFSINIQASQKVHLAALAVYGDGPSPFLINHCGPSTPTPVPTATPTISPTPAPTHDGSCLLPGQPTPTPDGTTTPGPWEIEIKFADLEEQPDWLSAPLPTRGGAWQDGEGVMGTNYSGGHWGASGSILRSYLEEYENAGLTQIKFHFQANGSGTKEYAVWFKTGNTITAGGVDADYTGSSGFSWPFATVTRTIPWGSSWDNVTFEVYANNFGYAWRGITLVGTGSLPVTSTPVPACTPTPTPSPTLSPTPRDTRTPTATPTPFTLTPTFTRTPTVTPFPIIIPTTAPTNTLVPTFNPTLLTPPPGPTWTPPPPTPTATDTPTFVPGFTPSPAPGSIAPSDGTDDGTGGWGELGRGISGLGANLWERVTGWTGDMTRTFTGIINGWNSAVPTALPNMPQCRTNPLANELCAIWYFLTFTVFSGDLGGVILSLAVLIVDLYYLFVFIRFVRAILAQAKEIRR